MVKRLSTRYLRDQISEIQSDNALCVYGFFLSLAHSLSTLWWVKGGYLPLFDKLSSEAVCWPLFPFCQSLRFSTPFAAQMTIWIYFAVCLLVGVSFLNRKTLVTAYFGLLAIQATKLALLAIDYRLRMNQHYMLFFASITFLFIPHKRDTLRVLIALFYFWAGTLKLNWEWISGDDLYHPLWLFSGRGVIFACSYVILMELVLVWGLFSKRPVVFWLTFTNLIIFHLFSWPIVHFFYPLLMFCILSIYVLCKVWPSENDSTLLARIRTKQWNSTCYRWILLFCALQLIPWAFPGDSAITGEGRLYALHMFDSLTTCENVFTFKYQDGHQETLPVQFQTSARMKCDPIVMYGIAKNLCRERQDKKLSDFDVSMKTRHSDEMTLKQIVNIKNFCSSDIAYNPLWHNSWINPR